MMMRLSVAATRLLLAGVPVLCLTSQKSYQDGGLMILTENLLDGAENDGTAAILLGAPRPYAAAASACSLLNEVLWDPDTQNFNKTLKASLAYQGFQGLAAQQQLYWVSKAHNCQADCRGIDAQGIVHENLDCRQILPSLCTQSAQVSSATSDDISETWQVTQNIGSAWLTGYRDLHVWKFRGLRYADPPQRFAYAQRRDFRRDDIINATSAGADCSQPIGEVESGSSEDCLFANVWTPYLPSNTGAEKSQLKPVMLYIYGGAFTTGSGKNPNTDGTNLASRGDVVVVSINYRVGSLGFLAFNDGVHKGNYAISDMVAALEWVQKYISFFGGDPDRVTIFGESAGGASVQALLASPRAQGLFQRAIMQSSPDGAATNGLLSFAQYPSVEQAYNTSTTKVLAQASCLNATNSIACLGNYTGFEIVNLPTNYATVVDDGTYINYRILVVNQSSYAVNVSVMTGINRDEAGVFVSEYPTNGTTLPEYFDKFVGPAFGLPAGLGSLIPLLIPSVPVSGTPEQIFNASLRVVTDAAFTCFNLAKSYSAAKHVAWKSTYTFEFNRTYQPLGYTQPWCTPPATPERPNGDPDQEYYKCHGGEQVIVFATMARRGQADRDGLDVPFLQLVVDYWSTFARTGDPNPDPGYLVARGYLSTLTQTTDTGPWDPVKSSQPTLRLLQWNGAQVSFVEQNWCASLGIPLTVLEG
ncbi:alpha/beta-hydrolase [Thozetella sp. PMI_491]|nr:alpha/beta-hydrolase [Thozetella sp. PMI_491]